MRTHLCPAPRRSYESISGTSNDNQTPTGGRKNQPDTATSYGGVAHGGAGRDVLIGNTGGDRLVDWVGEFSAYVPFLPSVADRARAADAGIDPLRNGEPYGELGMVMQSGFAWQEQTGVPADPQPGNANGTAQTCCAPPDFSGGTG